MSAVDISGESKGSLAAITGVTDRKAERELHESREMLQIVLDTILTAVFRKDRDSIHLKANRAWLKAAGLSSSEDVAGKTEYDLSCEKDQAGSFREYDRRIMRTGNREYDIIEN